MLDALTRFAEGRVTLIGRPSQRKDQRLVDILTDLKVDEVARLILVAGPRRALPREG